MSHWPTTLLAAVSIPAILTCGGGGDATGPPDGALTGTWVAEISSLAGSGATCTAEAIKLSLAQTGQAVHGTFQGGQVDCIYSGSVYTGNLGSGDIINGSFTHGDVAFDLEVPDFHFEGSRNGLTIGGTLLWQVIFVGTSRVFSLGGQWTAMPDPPPPGIADTIVLTPSQLLIPQLDSILLTSTVIDSRGDTLPGVAVTFKSSNTTIARVNGSGYVVSKGPQGSVDITATSGVASTVLTLAVDPIPADMSVTPGAIVMNRLSQQQLQVQVLDLRGVPITPSPPTTFSSSQPSVASVTPIGLVQASSTLGTASVLIECDTVSTTVDVTVGSFVETVTLTPQSAVLAPGGTQQLTVAVLDSASLAVPGALASFSSDLPSVADVSNQGLVTAAPGVHGSVSVMAEYAGVTDTAFLYVGTPPSGTISLSNRTGVDPWGIAVSANGVVYSGQVSDPGLLRGDLPSISVAPALQLRSSPALDVAFDPAGQRAFVTQQAIQFVMVVDVATNGIVDSLGTTGLGDPIAVAVSPDGQRLFVGTSTHVIVFDANTYQRLGEVPTGLVNSITPHPSLPYLYASNGAVLEIDASTYQIRRTFPNATGFSQGSAVTSDGTRLYVADEANPGIQEWDLGTGALVRRVGFLGGFGLALSRDGDFLFLTNPHSGSVQIIERRPLRLWRPVTISNSSPHRVAVDPVSGIAAVAGGNQRIIFIH